MLVGVWCARARTDTVHTLTHSGTRAALIIGDVQLVSVMEGSVNVMGRKGGNRLFPTLTLTLTFHHPEQSLLHKLHWLDHVIRVGVFFSFLFPWKKKEKEQTNTTTRVRKDQVG